MSYRRNLMIMGPSIVRGDENGEILANLTSRVSQLRPTCVVTDFFPGWGELGLRAAITLGLPIVGAAPFPSPAVMDTYRRRVRSSFVVAGSPSAFLDNPEHQEYYDSWLRDYVDVFLVHRPDGQNNAYVNRRLLSMGDTITVHDI